MTDVVVLAAGLGRRLASVNHGPKWLAPVNGACPASMQLRAFEQANVGRVHVVVSPQRDAIDAFLEPWHERLAIDVVVNHRAEELNNWYSLLLGLEAWKGDGGDLVVVNSDLFAYDGWFIQLLGDVGSATGDCALAVDPTRGRTDEAMKVCLDPTGEVVTGIGKVGIDAPAGEYVGLAWWSQAGAAELHQVLHRFLDEPGSADNWYEHGIQRHVEGGGRYAAVPVPSAAWVEIDDERDLEAARRLPVAVQRHG